MNFAEWMGVLAVPVAAVAVLVVGEWDYRRTYPAHIRRMVRRVPVPPSEGTGK